jgi:serine/threonine protein phosphatase PrpC
MHKRTELTNQDAMDWLPESGTGSSLVLAVSDGHGSAKCFRSDVGSRFAVEVATTEMQHLLDEHLDLSDLSAIKRMAEEQLLRSVASAWHTKVETHLAEHPFADEEWQCLEEKGGPRARQEVEEMPVLAYGATLLTVLATEAFILYLQLGDGDIVCVNSAGEATRPLPQDERLIANETTSLCMPDPWQEMRVRLASLSEQPPSMIQLSTDGYRNAFRSEALFLETAQEFLWKMQTEGLDALAQELTGILNDASHHGSGDDVTVGIMKRIERTDVDASMQRDTEQPQPITEQTPSIAQFEQMSASYAVLCTRFMRLQWVLGIVSGLALAGLVLTNVPWDHVARWLSPSIAAAAKPHEQPSADPSPAGANQDNTGQSRERTQPQEDQTTQVIQGQRERLDKLEHALEGRSAEWHIAMEFIQGQRERLDKLEHRVAKLHTRLMRLQWVLGIVSGLAIAGLMLTNMLEVRAVGVAPDGQSPATASQMV